MDEGFILMAQKPINLTLQAFSDHSGIGVPIHTIHADAAGQDFSLSTLLVHPWYDSEPYQVLEICNIQDWHYDAVVELGRKQTKQAPVKSTSSAATSAGVARAKAQESMHTPPQRRDVDKVS